MTEERYAELKRFYGGPYIGLPSHERELIAYCDELRERVRQLEADLKACGDTLPGPHPLSVEPCYDDL